MDIKTLKNGSIERMCRFCFSENATMILLFSKKNQETLAQLKTLDMISFIANIKLKFEENLPKNLCTDCHRTVEQFYTFKMKILDSEKKLRQDLSNLSPFGNIDSKTSLYLNNVKNENKLSPYQCSLCLEQYKAIDKLKKHVQVYHSDQETLSDIKFLQTQVTTENDLEITINIKEESGPNLETVQNNLETPNFNLLSNDDDFQYDDPVEPVIEQVVVKKPPKPKKTYPCSICSMKLRSKRLLYEHEKIKHIVPKPKTRINSDSIDPTEDGNYQCSHCLRSFARKSNLTTHLQKHELVRNPHTCSICKREFQHKAHLANHILKLHSTEKGLKCEVCDKSFPDKSSLESHKSVHEKQKNHKCKLCPKMFYLPSTLKDHLRVHTGEKPFLCPQCGKGFTQNTNLLDHIRRHQGIKPFKCEECHRGFVSKGELSAHSRKHSGAHPFVCGDCGGKFTTSSSLVKHRRTHTGERPYQCDLCTMAFASSGTLKNHRRTHTGEKPHRCPHCEKAFVQKQDMTTHIRCHTGERPYVCPHCGQAFRQSSALKTHQKLHQFKEGFSERQ